MTLSAVGGQSRGPRTWRAGRAKQRFRLIMLSLLPLLACEMSQPEPFEIGLRNPTAPLGGTTRFDVARFAGNWSTLYCLGVCATEIRYDVSADGGLIRRADGVETIMNVSAPGVLREIDGPGTLVVMWIDEGFRTAAIGDADGRWAAILDRAGGSPDRIQAARDILDFNGWDVAKLTQVTE